MRCDCKKALLLATCLGMGVMTFGNYSFANPEGGVVTAGGADISSQGKTLTIDQHTDRAIIDWRSFNIEADEATRFNQPSSSSVTLNRVNNADPSYILGKMSANGNVILINPNGVLIGKDATIDVNGMAGSTADVHDDAFMRGGVVSFDKAGNPDAAIINHGTITAKDAGLVGLVAPNVANHGVIKAKLGRVALASGDTATMDFYGDDLIKVAVSDDVQSQMIVNTGTIEAAGGTIQMEAAAGRSMVNSLIVTEGELHAPSIQQKGGRIIIGAAGANAVKGNVAVDKGKKAGASTVLVGGMINASGYGAGEKGGVIEITGDNVALAPGAVLNASGDAGGGNIKVGGDYLGTGDTAAAMNTYVDGYSLILNDAVTQGDGGRTIIWSDGATAFHGNVLARGGAEGGNGGFVETSGHKTLLANGYVDLSAEKGNKGTYLLDPNSIKIYGDFAPDYLSSDGSIDLASKLTVWFDASAITGLADGAEVGTWDDLSTNGNDAVQPGANKPIYVANGLNGKGVVRFNGSQVLATLQSVGITGGSERYLAGLINSTTGGNKNVIGYGVDGAGAVYDMMVYNSTLIGHFYGGGYDTIGGAPSYTPGTWVNEALGYKSGILSVYKNGTFGNATAMNLNTSDSTLKIGGGTYAPFNGFSGDIAEVYLYSENVSADVRALLNQYQIAKWGVGMAASDPAVEAAMAMDATAGYSLFTTRYLEYLAKTADVVLQATNNITLDLQGDTLNLASGAATGKSLTLRTTAGDINTLSGGAIVTKRTGSGAGAFGNITFDAAGAINIDHALTLDAQTNGVVTLKAANLNVDGAITVPGTVNLLANNMDINADITAGTLNVSPTNATEITMAGAAGGGLQLSSAELDHLRASALNIGMVSSFSGYGAYGGHLNIGAHDWSNGITSGLMFRGDNGITITGDQNFNAAAAHAVRYYGNAYAIGGALNTSIARSLSFTGSSATLNIGTGVAAAGIDDAELDRIGDGWSLISFGGETPTLNVYAYDNWRDPISLQANGVTTVHGAQSAAAGSNATMKISTGYSAAAAPNINADIDMSAATGGAGTITLDGFNHTGLGSHNVGANLTSGSGGIVVNRPVVVTGATAQLRTFNAGTGTFYVNSNGSSISYGDRHLSILADSANILGTITGTGTLSLANYSAGRSIGLGNGGGLFSLDAAEMARLSAGKFIFGGLNGGVLDFDTSYDFSASELELRGGSIVINEAVNAQRFVAQAADDITLNHTVSASGTGDALVLAAGDDFINAVDDGVLHAANGRWLVYAADTGSNTRNGLMPDASDFGKTFGADAPATIGAGNRFVYATSTRPSLVYQVGNGTVEYGDAYAGTPSLTYQSGLLSGDTLSTIGLSGTAVTSTSYTLGDNAGAYSGVLLGGSGTLYSKLGYQFAYLAGDLTVTKAALVVTADTKSREYGDLNPTLTGNITGFKLSQNAGHLDAGPVYGTVATQNSDVGTYTIVASGAADHNYTFTYQAGALHITPATVTVSLVDGAPSRFFGHMNPAFEMQYSGFKLGEDKSVLDVLPTVSTTALASSVIGNYAINITGGSDQNYHLVYGSPAGTLSVGAVPVPASDILPNTVVMSVQAQIVSGPISPFGPVQTKQTKTAYNLEHEQFEAVQGYSLFDGILMIDPTLVDGLQDAAFSD